MDIAERVDDLTNAVRLAVQGELRAVWKVMPVIVQSGDGHTAVLQPAISGIVKAPDGTITNPALPVLSDTPIHFTGGGGVSSTHPVSEGDEGVVIFTDRAQDTWHQSGGVNNAPIDDRSHHMADGRYIPGGRSDPRKLANVSQTEHHIRSDDGKHTLAHSPTNGTKIKSVPSSDGSTDPYNSALSFSETTISPTGISHSTTTPTQSSSITHDLITGALAIASSASIGLSAPSLGLPTGSITAPALAAGAASSNVGTLGGDLSGTLPNPEVVGILHVAGANALGHYANDSAAALGGVPIGGLYLNNSFSGFFPLCARVT